MKHNIGESKNYIFCVILSPKSEKINFQYNYSIKRLVGDFPYNKIDTLICGALALDFILFYLFISTPNKPYTSSPPNPPPSFPACPFSKIYKIHTTSTFGPERKVRVNNTKK